MTMKSLLEVNMTQAQVKEACKAWASERTKVPEDATVTVTLTENTAETGRGITATVVYFRKRERERNGGEAK